MMIPSEMPVLSQLTQSRGGENGHGFSDTSNLFSANPSDMLRSGSGGLFGGQFGPDQMQMLQSLQQIGQKHKEVRTKVYTSLSCYYDPMFHPRRRHRDPRIHPALFAQLKEARRRKKLNCFKLKHFLCLRNKTRC